MKINKKAISLIEAVIVVVIISIGLLGVYKLYINSNRLLDSIETKIQAIQIAREGIEAVENIRDTNWILFPGDTQKCFNTFNYNAHCLTDNSTRKFGQNGNTENFKIYKNNANRWILEEQIPSIVGKGYKDSDYQNYYKVGLDEDGLYTQTGAVNTGTGRVVVFTRRIEITGNQPLKKGDGTMTSSGILVKSIVEWTDLSTTGVRKIELENLMTNYKK